MPKRQYTTTVRCAHEGCKEYGIFQYDNRKEYVEASKRRSAHPWKCTRHTKPEEVLTPDNLERVCEMVVSEDNQYGHRYFGKVSGFIFGDGYKAYARDFPPGTKIVVTAKVILP